MAQAPQFPSWLRRGASEQLLLMQAVVVGTAVLAAVSTVFVDTVAAIHTIAFLPSLLLLIGVTRLDRSDIPRRLYPKIIWWTVGGGAGLAVVAGTMVAAPGVTISSPAWSMTLSWGVGTVGGFFVGYNEARAIREGEYAERERIRAEVTADQEQRTQELNHLLRHDIRNSVAVIEGHAAMLTDRTQDADVARHVSTIERQAGAIKDLLENVRTYVIAVQQGGETKPVDLLDVLGREVERFRGEFPEIPVTVDVGDDAETPKDWATGAPGGAGLRVVAGDLLGSVFHNLLRNAAIHNEPTDLAVAIEVTADADSVNIRISDTGGGIPAHVQETIFQPAESGHHGFGLYLVNALIDRYDGSVTLESSSDAGSTFHIELLRVAPVADSDTAMQCDTSKQSD